MKLAFFLLIVVAASCHIACGTSVVILANATGIVVASDSKVMRSKEKICKVLKIGTIYWAMSGYMDNSVTGYGVAKP